MNTKTYDFSRRRLLQGAGAVAGVAAASRFTGSGSWLPTAHAQSAVNKQALVVINLRGGYNSLFCSADSFLNSYFGVTASNIEDLGNGLFIDAPTYGTLPTVAKQNMATVGVRHGLTSHDAARNAVLHVGGQSALLRLASEMGGDGSIKAAYMGNMPDGDQTPIGGVSLQRITDMGSTIAALGGYSNPTIPDRDIAAMGLTRAQLMSARVLGESPKSLSTVSEGYPAAIDTLNQPVKMFNFGEAATAYGLGATQTAVNSFRSMMLAAELMVHAGANVIHTSNGGWDTHGDNNGARVRQQMTGTILPPLRTFLNRMWNEPGFDVTVAILGEFARDIPGSDHQPNLSVTVIGKRVKVGTTGRTDNDCGLPAGTPNVNGLWAYLAEAVHVPGTPFGMANPHTSIIK